MNIFFSPRLSAILKMLADDGDYVTTAFLATALDISTRTVYRELNDVDYLLTPFGLHLEAKSGHGYRLVGERKSIDQFFSILESSGEMVPWKSVEERRNLILIEILQSKGSIKLLELGQILSVSEGTISRDLDYVEPILQEYKITLIRKPGHGLEVVGDEENIRKAIADYVHERLISDTKASYDSKENLHAYFEDQSSGILSLLNKDDLHNVIDVLSHTSVNIINRITEHSLIGLVVHLTVSVSRIRNGEEIALDPSILKSMREDPLYKDAKVITGDIEDRFRLKFPEAEVGYILMHLRGTRPRYLNKEDDIGSVLPNYETMMLVEKLVQRFSQITYQDFNEDEMLITGLMAHLVPSLNRIKYQLEIRNPLLDEIKEEYGELFEIVKETSKVIQLGDGLVMSDDEIAYLTLHFGAAIERKKYTESPLKLNLGVVCASGIGVSSLLSSKIKATFMNINKVVPLSVEAVLNNEIKGIDLLVATLDIEAKIPTVYVNTLLKEEDLNKIEAAMNKIKYSSRTTLKEDTNINLDIIEQTQFVELDFTNKINDNITVLSKLCSEDILIQADIFDSVIERERQASLIIEEIQFVMYHASVESIDKPYLIFFKAKDEKRNIEYQNLDMGVLMLIPKPASAIDRYTLSNVSKIISESSALLMHINNRNLEGIKKELKERMRDYE